METLLAEGRSARVYRVRAKDGSLRAARVARHDLDEVSRAWFEADARLRKSLDHPHLPRTFLVARLPSGEPVEVVELLAGPDLAAHLDAAPRGLPLADAARVMGELASALDCLHRQPRPLAHGALAPTRVRFRPRDGAARLLGVQSPDRAPHAPIAYRSPETHDGATPTPASDVFGLATLAFEILTGRAAFPEGPPRSAPEAWPSAHTIRAEVPDGVDAVLARAWALDPAARPASATGFVTALTAALGPAPAAPTPAPEELTTREVTVPVRTPGRAHPPPGTRPSVPPPPDPAPAPDAAAPSDAFDPTPLEIVSPPDRTAPRVTPPQHAPPQSPAPLPQADVPPAAAPPVLTASQDPVSAPEPPRPPPIAPASEPPQMTPPQPGNPPAPEVPEALAPARVPHPIEASAPAAFRDPPPASASAAQRAWLRQPTLVLPPQPAQRAWHRTPGVLAAMLMSAAVVVAGLGHAVALAVRPASPTAVTVSPQAAACPPCPVCLSAPAPCASEALPAPPVVPPHDPETPTPTARPDTRRVAPSPPPIAARRAPAPATSQQPPPPRPFAGPRPARAPRTRLIQQTPF